MTTTTWIDHLDDDDTESVLQQIGVVFADFLEQDSGCVSWGVEVAGCRYFVKAARDDRGATALARARTLAQNILHPCLPVFIGSRGNSTGPVVVYQWVDGENLYAPAERRFAPECAHARFLKQPLDVRLAAIDRLLDLHLLLAEQDYIVVDLYDGCLLYDFDTHQLHVCDLDEYRRGPFRLEEDRLLGSQRFLPPEGSRRGAVIDHRSSVFTLGRACAVLLDVDRNPAQVPDRLASVIAEATQPQRDQRFRSVEELTARWRSAAAGH